MNLDRAKNILGKEIFNAIGMASKEQLENWLADVKIEMILFARVGDARYSKLYIERELIQHRLGKCASSHLLGEKGV